MHFVPLDLSDLNAVAESMGEIEKLLDGRQIDILIANAGVAPVHCQRSAQGYELGFAVNVLGHFVFVNRLTTAGVFGKGGRLVVMTAELYPVARDCSPHQHFRDGLLPGTLAYCHTKLGTMWFARGYAARHPEVEVCPVHPGVVASGISSMSDWPLVRRILLDERRGAQIPLYVATTQDLTPGAYYTNKLGEAKLRRMISPWTERRSMTSGHCSRVSPGTGCEGPLQTAKGQKTIQANDPPISKSAAPHSQSHESFRQSLTALRALCSSSPASRFGRNTSCVSSSKAR